MNLLGTEIARLGMGCWPIGGPCYKENQSLGFGKVDDAESIRTIRAALDAGITLFDTAAVYGAGHAERLLGQALSDRPNALIVSKIGMSFDAVSKQVTGEEADPAEVMPAIERCLARLRRDRIDVLLLHLSPLPLSKAEPLFSEMDKACQAGKIRSFGWSSDFPDEIEAMADRPDFVAVEHAMNVFVDAPTMQCAVEDNDLVALIRSPLAMGVLTGKFDAHTIMANDDIRASNETWRDYFRDGGVNPIYLNKLDAIRELLQTGGRTPSQGALCWLLAKSERNVPVPGARTEAQIRDNAGAIEHGPLPDSVMTEIEGLIEREPEGGARPR